MDILKPFTYWLWLLSLGFMTLSPSSARAAHLVGGEMSYECIGNNNYRLRMVIYRDCASGGANFDQPAIITVYDGNNQLIDNRRVFYLGRSQLPITAPNACTSLPPFICTEKAVYVDTINLPPHPAGYVLSYQRCCRNAGITNIPNPGSWGNTYTIEIPANDSGCNSSPSFTNPPPVALCLGFPINLDFSANETDGDSLVYELCDLYNGGGNSMRSGPLSPRPDTALPPPYARVPFRNNFSPTYPLPSAPALSLDRQTGLLTGIPNQAGQYVFAVCVTEYRNGQKLSTLRRDFQFNVTNNCQGVAAVILGQDVDTSSRCSGRTVNFKEQCVNANSFFWDFGDPNATNDTSRLANPTYTYGDTGTYTVMLIAGPNSACADTTYSQFEVYNAVDVSFSLDKESCFDLHSLNLAVTGTYSDSATVRWQFGGNTNFGFTSTATQLNNLRYQQPGIYPIQLTVTDFGCTDQFFDTVRLYARPVLLHEVPQLSACLPVQVQFRDSSTYEDRAIHYWDFGDGFTSNQRSPLHTYQRAGNYDVFHRVITLDGCRDTMMESFQNRIEVLPVPEAGLSVNPELLTIYEPELQIVNLSRQYTSFKILLPDGRTIRPSNDFIYSVQDTGRLTFTLVAMNEYGCTDSAFRSVQVEQPLNFFIPNAFTPNQDGVNDRFEYVMTGILSHQITIFNRWGEMVYRSENGVDYWDGTHYRTGEKLPGGVYSYRIQARLANEKGGHKFLRGHLTLVR